MELLLTNLKRDGWFRFASNSDCEADTALAADRAAELLGHLIGGRAGVTREMIIPRDKSAA